MAVGHKRDSPFTGTGSPDMRGDVGQLGTATVDDLLTRVARGDAKAFIAVCEQLSGAVLRLVSRIVENRSRAELVAADVLVEVWRTAPAFSPAEGSGRNWVMTMAHRMAISHAETAGNYRIGEPNPPGPAWTLADRTARKLLAHRGLASLPEPQREAVLLACCGYSYPEIADLAGVSAETAAGRIRDGLLELSNGAKQPTRRTGLGRGHR
jgi:RNA polymerase sigma-70 factor (ECF subfamily)